MMKFSNIFRAFGLLSGLVFLFSISTELRAQVAGGAYTIGSTGNYATFTAAKLALDSGITGPVVFNVEPGVYNEQLAFTGIPGASAVNTVTFQSLTGDSSSVVLQFAGSSAANYVILLNNTSHVILKGMTIRSLGGASGRVINFAFNSNHNTLTNCVIDTDTLSTINTSSAIYSDAAGNYNITISNNIINGGFHGIHWNGTQTLRNNKLTLINNTVTNYHSYGFNLVYTDSLHVEGNRIFNRPITASIYYPIQIFNTDGYGLVNANYILANGSGNSYGLRVQKAITTNTIHLLLTNNMIIQSTNTGTNYGISLNIANYVSVLNNSVLLTAGSVTAGRAFFLSTLSTITTSNIIIRNNNFANTGGGYAYYINNPAAVIQSDFNNYYSTGVNMAYWGANRTTIAALQSANQMDAGSLNVMPGYISVTDLHSTAIALYQAGSPHPAVPFDFDGDLRDPLMPCIGADEFSVSSNDAGVVSLVHPVTPCPGVTDSVKIEVKNWGLVNMNGFTVHWSVNNQAKDSVVFAGVVPPGSSVVVPLDTFTFSLGVSYQMVFVTAYPNGQLDDDTTNDTLVVVKKPTLSGVYTIGTGVAHDFPGFSHAVMALDSFGVCGHVVFEVASGIYNEQVSISQISGACDSATVTFVSAANDSSMVTLQYAASNVLENYVVKLNGASYIRFKHIGMAASQTSTHSRVVEMINGASYNRIEHCMLVSNPVSSTTSNNVYLLQKSNYNQILNNNLMGGYASVQLYGTSTSPDRSWGNQISGNTINGFYYYGINAGQQDTLMVTGNTVASGVNNTGYGIYVVHATASRISSNQIVMTNSGYGSCIYVGNFHGTATHPALIDNNFAVKINGSTLYSSGINVNTSDHLRVVFNSVRVDDLYLTSRGIYVNGGSGHHYLNNNVEMAGAGYAIYVNTPLAVDSADFNNYYTHGSWLGYWVTNHANLTDYQNGTGRELNSLSVKPMFVSATDLHVSNSFLNGTATPLPYITHDIDGDLRNTQIPDIGADEFNSPPNDAWLLALKSPVTPVNPGVSHVSVVLRNGGSNPLLSVSLEWSVNGVSQTPVSWTGNLNQGSVDTNVVLGNTAFTSGSYDLKVWVVSANGTSDPFPYNDTLFQTIHVYQPPMRGQYTIGATGADFLSFTDAIQTMTVIGIDSAVVFLVDAGNYQEQINISHVTGLSPINTVTFRSASLDSSSVILTYAASGATNYVLRFDGVQYVTFSHITISATNPAAGYAVVFRNGASRNTVRNCIIKSPSGNQTSSVPVYFTHLFNHDYNHVIGNSIQNGYYGIYIYGAGVSSQQKGTQIVGNHITGFHHSGVYAFYSDSTIIRNNHIQSSNATTLKGIYIFNTYYHFDISRNSIVLNSNAQTHGIYLYTYLGNPDQGIIHNNYISVNSHGNTDFGIYIGAATYIDVVFNTVSIHGNGIQSRALFTYSNVAFINLRNNNLVNLAGGYSIYIGTPSITMFSDRNNLYTNGINLAYYFQGIPDLANWQMQTVTLDSNSISADPGFYSNTSYQVSASALDGAALPFPGITTDIRGVFRDPATPDIGAYEFMSPGWDAGMAHVISPSVSHGLAGEPFQIEVDFRNFGSNVITSCYLGYQVDNQPPLMQTWTGSLHPGGFANHVFPGVLQLPEGLYQIRLFVVLSGDTFPNNDTLLMVYSSMPMINISYADDFNDVVSLWSSEGSARLWQQGIPAGAVIDSAFSSPSVWGTNLSGDYGPNMQEYLYSPFFNFVNVTNATLKFRQWFITDNQQDGMQVQVSVNGGATWSTLGFYNDPFGSNWYNTIASGSHFFSGSSNGWEESSMSLASLNNSSGPVQFRFRFFSNSSGETEGWAIDDFSIAVSKGTTDLKMLSVLAPSATTQAGSQVPVTVVVQNDGLTAVQNVPVFYRVGQSVTVRDTIMQSLQPGDVLQYTFSAAYTAPVSAYTLWAGVRYPGDVYSFNDSISRFITSTPPQWDAGVIDILAPDDSLSAAGSFPVVVLVINYGTDTITSMSMIYQADVQPVVQEQWNGSLLPGHSLQYQFQTPVSLGALTTVLCARVLLTGDVNPANDQHCETKVIVVGIDEIEFSSGFLQNLWPNPAASELFLQVRTPVTFQGVLEIREISGSLMFSRHEALVSGTSLLRLDVSDLPQGVYLIGFRSAETLPVYRKILIVR